MRVRYPKALAVGYDRVAMNTTVSSRPVSIGINPEILKWAREWRGRSLEEAAHAVKKAPTDIADWEADRGSPTVQQARALAKYYDRPFLEFFLDTPPVVPLPELVADYRMHAGAADPSRNRDLQFIQRWAASRRIDALGLISDLGLELPAIPDRLFTTIGQDPEAIAEATREVLGFPIQEQIALTKADALSLPTMLRTMLERIGVMTLRRPDLKEFFARGLTLAERPLPVIVFQNEAATAQAFTLIHEFGHVLLGESAISGKRERSAFSSPVENWCDRFAASFLMPREQIRAIAGPRPDLPSHQIQDDELDRLAEIFRVSPHAMIVRLVQLGYVEEDFYWLVKKPQFDHRDQEFKSFGRSKYYGSRFRSMYGDLYTGLVLDAWATGTITNHGAAEYLGIKRISHLEDIRERFQQE